MKADREGSKLDREGKREREGVCVKGREAERDRERERKDAGSARWIANRGGERPVSGLPGDYLLARI